MAAPVKTIREAIHALFESPCGPLRADKRLREVVVHLMVSCSTAAASALTAFERQLQVTERGRVVQRQSARKHQQEITLSSNQRQLLDGDNELVPVSAIIVAKEERGKLAYRLKVVRARLRSCETMRPAACLAPTPKLSLL